MQMSFIHSTGPGGQNVNKVASVCQLRFNVHGSPSLNDEVKLRLVKLAGRRVNREGVLVIEAKRHRTREQNREDALQRLIGLIQKALEKPRARRATRPSRAAKATRLDEKKKHSQLKRVRRKPSSEWE